MTDRMPEDRLRNTRAWAATRVGQMSGAEVIVSAIDELLSARDDAQRYRWLRAQHWTDGEYVVTRVSNLQPGMQIYSTENLDAVVDSALSADQPKTSEVERLRTENERLRVIARRIVDARERDHWNDLDDAVDDLLASSADQPTPPHTGE